MGKVLVLYNSASGNTAKMAVLIAEGAAIIPGIDVRLRKVEDRDPASRAFLRLGMPYIRHITIILTWFLIY